VFAHRVAVSATKPPELSKSVAVKAVIATNTHPVGGFIASLEAVVKTDPE
jgi:hypothetical protein